MNSILLRYMPSGWPIAFLLNCTFLQHNMWIMLVPDWLVRNSLFILSSLFHDNGESLFLLIFDDWGIAVFPDQMLFTASFATSSWAVLADQILAFWLLYMAKKLCCLSCNLSNTATTAGGSAIVVFIAISCCDLWLLAVAIRENTKRRQAYWTRHCVYEKKRLEPITLLWVWVVLMFN